MSAAALDALVERQRALLAALDQGDVAAIEQASGEMRDALGAVAAAGGWTARPETRARLDAAIRLGDAARARVNYLADLTHRRLDRLAALSGGPRSHSYRRSGRAL